ncbi:hypothetical protein BK125_15455 [Paenibacillus odorifer]|uniref:Uncharacterized protein n=1 Tax=Paenibacillus odorifer TaxID=189426 RepID=A0ABX3GT80_9BACL|nr:hypothetical protein BK125_15455 [Paenibacillus odorifer]OMD36628.1 hypothetical protein BSO21_06895 [Paenibacillus odorifer]OMD98968.1 hypothetical protein BSK54_21275 [Paenibacillus odorifer]
MSAWIGSITFFGAVILYILLSLGLPYGEFAMGGRHRIMPSQMRVACGVSVVIQLVAILYLLQAGNVISIGLPFDRRVCYFFAVYLMLNTIMNLLSRSMKEKLVMTPLSLITAICFGITAMNG